MRFRIKWKLRELLCWLLGHSPMVDNSGYAYCGRCRDHLPIDYWDQVESAMWSRPAWRGGRR